MNNRKNKTGFADYIADKKVFAATMFARKMIREGTSPGLANHIAALYHNVDETEVAKYVGQHAGRVNAIKNRRKKSRVNFKK